MLWKFQFQQIQPRYTIIFLHRCTIFMLHSYMFFMYTGTDGCSFGTPTFLLQGDSECHIFETAPACSGGNVFKNCHDQVWLKMMVLYCLCS